MIASAETSSLLVHWTMIADGVVAIVVFEAARSCCQRRRARRIARDTYEDARIDGTYEPPWEDATPRRDL